MKPSNFLTDMANKSRDAQKKNQDKPVNTNRGTVRQNEVAPTPTRNSYRGPVSTGSNFLHGMAETSRISTDAATSDFQERRIRERERQRQNRPYNPGVPYAPTTQKYNPFNVNNLMSGTRSAQDRTMDIAASRFKQEQQALNELKAQQALDNQIQIQKQNAKQQKLKADTYNTGLYQNASEDYQALQRRVAEGEQISNEELNQARDKMNQLGKDAGYNAFDRMVGQGVFKKLAPIAVSSAEQYAASNINTMGVITDIGTAGRVNVYRDYAYDYERKLNQETETYNRMVEANKKKPGTFSDEDLKMSQDLINEYKQGLNIMTTMTDEDTQRQAVQAFYGSADVIQDDASDRLQYAENGLGTFGRMVVRASASSVQTALDAATNAIFGLNPNAMIPLASRAFGGAAQEARRNNPNSTVEQQVKYGVAQALKEVLTEKMSNISGLARGAYGEGLFDDAVDGVFDTIVDKLAESEEGKAIIRGLLELGASGVGEGWEEFVGKTFEREMPLLYQNAEAVENYKAAKKYYSEMEKKYSRGENISYSQLVAAYNLLEEAGNEVGVDTIAETLISGLEDFAVGAISGVMGGPSSIITNNVATNMAINEASEEYRELFEMSGLNAEAAEQLKADYKRVMKGEISEEEFINHVDDLQAKQEEQQSRKIFEQAAGKDTVQTEAMAENQPNQQSNSEVKANTYSENSAVNNAILKAQTEEGFSRSQAKKLASNKEALQALSTLTGNEYKGTATEVSTAVMQDVRSYAQYASQQATENVSAQQTQQAENVQQAPGADYVTENVDSKTTNASQANNQATADTDSVLRNAVKEKIEDTKNQVQKAFEQTNLKGNVAQQASEMYSAGDYTTVSPEVYAQAYAEAYNYGATGVRNFDNFQSQYSGALTNEQLTHALNAGRGYYLDKSAKDAQRTLNSVMSDGSEGSYGFIDSEYSKVLEHSTRAVLGKMAKLLKTRVSIMAPTGTNGSNGYYDSTNNIIYIAANATFKKDNAKMFSNVFAVTFAHESVHRMKDMLGADSNAYKNYENYCVDKFASRHKQTSEDAIASMQRQYNDFYQREGIKDSETGEIRRCSVEEAREEIASTYTEEVLTQEALYRVMLDENIQAAGDGLKGWRKILNSLKNAFTGKQESAVYQEYQNTLAEYQKLYREALKAQGNGQSEGANSKNYSTKKITLNMSDEERTEILKEKTLIAHIFDSSKYKISEADLADLESSKINLIKDALIRVGSQFNVFSGDVPIYRNDDMELVVSFSKASIRESVNKKITSASDLAKLMPIMEESIKNAIGINSEGARYFADDSTLYFHELFGGYVEGDSFVPIRFGIRETTDGHCTLYVLVSEDKIKTEVSIARNKDNPHSPATRSVYEFSIADLISKINSPDLLKYFPDGLLSDEQKVKKYEAIESQIQYTNDKNDKTYIKALEKGDDRLLKRIVESAAKAAGYTSMKMYHSSASDNITEFKLEKIRANETDAPFNGFWFSDDPNTLPAWVAGKRTYPVFLDMRNTASWKTVREAEKIAYDNIYNGKGHEASRSVQDETRYVLQDMGFDSVIFSDKPKVDIDAFNKTGKAIVETDRYGKTYVLKKDTEYGGVDLYYYNKDSENKLSGSEERQLSELRDKINNLDKQIEYFESLMRKNLADYQNRKLSAKEYMSKTDPLMESTDRLEKEKFQVKRESYPLESKALNSLDNSELGEWLTGYENVEDFIKLNETVYVVFNPSQIKSAELVTYDDEHNIIPISQRFNSDSNDIRYSVKNTTQDENGNVFDKDGNYVATFGQDGNISFSLKPYQETGREALVNYLDRAVKSEDLSREEADDILKQLDDSYEILRKYADKGVYAPFSAWADAKIVYRTDTDTGKLVPVYSVESSDSLYPMNMDFSKVCTKRRPLDAVFNEMVHRGLINKFKLDGPQIVLINQIIKSHGLNIACDFCFVDSRRYKQADVADKFTNLWNKEVRRYFTSAEAKKNIPYFNFAKNETLPVIEGTTDKNNLLDESAIEELLSKAEGNSVPVRVRKYLANHPEARKLVDRGDFMASFGFGAALEQNPDVTKFYNSKKGAGGPKGAYGDVPYNNEIIKLSSWTAEKAFAIGGVRVQSNSDYVPRLVFDYMQMVAEMQAKGLPSHIYTKVPALIKQFGKTGIKFNMSLVPKFVEGGVAPGLDANGNYAWADESISQTDGNYNEEAGLPQFILDVQNDPEYSKNCGTIAVGVSVEHILKMLADPNIRMIIPYHKSGMNPIVAKMLSIDSFQAWEQYTKVQGTGKNLKSPYKQYDYQAKLAELGSKEAVLKDFVDWCNSEGYQKNGKGGKLDPKMEYHYNSTLQELGKAGDADAPRTAAKEYIKWCAENGYVPKFVEFANNENYYKLLEDFTLFDADGTYAPQEAVKMNFPTSEDLFGDMESLILEGLEQDAIDSAKIDENINSIIEEIDRVLTEEQANRPEPEPKPKKKKKAESNEVKHSIKNSETAYESASRRVSEQKAIKELTSELKKAMASSEYWKAQTKTTKMPTITKKAATTVLSDLSNRYQVHLDKDFNAEIADRMQKLAADMLSEHKNDNEAWARIQDESDAIAKLMVENSGELVGADTEAWNNLKGLLKNVKINIPESVKIDLQGSVKEFNAWAKQEFPWLKTSPNGVALDSWFNSNIAGTDQFGSWVGSEKLTESEELESLIGLYESLQGTYEFPADLDMYEVISGLSNEIQASLINTDDIRMVTADSAYFEESGKKQTIADKYEERLNNNQKQIADLTAQLKTEGATNAKLAQNLNAQLDSLNKANENLKANYQKAQAEANEERAKAEKLAKQNAKDSKQINKLQTMLQANEAQNKAKMEMLKQHRDEKIAELKRYHAEQKKEASRRKHESEDRTHLLKVANRLAKMKTNMANRALINELIGDLDLVAKSLTNKKKLELQDLQKWYEDQKKNNPNFVLNSEIEKKLGRLTSKKIADMDIEDVRDLTKVLLNLEKNMRDYNRAIRSLMNKDMYQAGMGVIDDIRNSKGVDPYNIFSNAKDTLITEQLSPVRYVNRLVGYNESSPLVTLTNELADGQRDMIDFQRRASDMFTKWSEDKKFMDKISGKNAEEIEINGIGTENFETVKITPMMRMSLYLHSLNQDNLAHIVFGGLTVPDIKLYKQGKLQEAYARGTTIRLTPENIAQICKGMSEKERDYARAIHKYFNGMSQREINYVSEALDGFSLAEVENYFPINTDNSFVNKEIEGLKQDGTIEGMGFLKERVHAKNAILLRDAGDVLQQSIRMTSKYVGLAIPVRNMNKLLNVKTSPKDAMIFAQTGVRKAIDETWGRRANSYIDKMLTDLQNPSVHKDAFDRILSTLRGNSAGAVLTLNPGVALKQAASYPTAASVVGWTALAKALADTSKTDIDLIQRYTPLLWYRSQGFNTQELGELAERHKSLPKALNWIQAMDVATTTKLWKAAEYNVRAEHPELTRKTDAYYKQVAQVYNRIIEETQPNYTTMQRPQILRSENEFVKTTFAMFKTQPLQNFNILYDSIGRYEAKKRAYTVSQTAEAKQAYELASRDMRRAFGSQAVQLFTFAAMTFAWQAFRGKASDWEDEDGNITFLSWLKGMGKNMLSSIVSMFIGGSEAYNLVSSAITGDTYYGVENLTLSTITDSAKALQKYTSVVADVVNGKTDLTNASDRKDFLTDTKDMGVKLAPMMGIPAGNIENVTRGIIYQIEKNTDFKKVEESDLWKKADNRQKGAVNKALYGLAYEGKGLKSADKSVMAISGNNKLTDTQFLLWELALSMADKPTEKGKYGSYTQDEVKNALSKVDLTKKQKELIWDIYEPNAKKNPYK